MRLSFVIVCLVSVLSVGCGGGALLRDPGPTLVPNGLAPQNVRDAIVTALPRHRWVAESEDANRLIVGFYKGSHAVRVVVTYDTQYVTIRYAESMELDYRVNQDGTQFIHPNYNRWVENLRRDIERSLSQAAPASGVPVQVIVVPTQ